MRAAVEDFCARIGADTLLVQGAGGNVSWKDGDSLWVKASGTWLAEARQKDIFVPIDLAALRKATALCDFSVKPSPIGTSALRPSIETLLHGLMPHRVVVHLHAVDALAYLVRRSFPAGVNQQIGGKIDWVSIAYCKPGAELARAVAQALAERPSADLVMMQSHGIVIGGHDVAEVGGRLECLLEALRLSPRPSVQPASPAVVLSGYAAVADPSVQQLALDPVLFERLDRDWALYPDHVVFLGPRPIRHHSAEEFRAAWPEQAAWPELLFLKGMGVFARPSFSDAKLAQLRCYYDVLARQAPQEPLQALNDAQIAELLNWDAEKYRMSLAR